MADPDAWWLTDFVKWLGIGGLALGWHAARKTGEVVNRVETLEKRVNPTVGLADHDARIKNLERAMDNHVERLDVIASTVNRLEALEEIAQRDRTEMLALLRAHVKPMKVEG